MTTYKTPLRDFCFVLDEVLDVSALDREAFMALLREPATLARMEHILETRKPLRNKEQKVFVCVFC